MTDNEERNEAKVDDFEPTIVGFLCNWCSYAGADKAGAAEIAYPPNMRPVRVMCTGRIDPQFVLKAFERGADGVLVLGCHPGDCHYKEQNYRAVQRHRILLRLLAQFGIPAERCRFGYISAAEGQEFAATVREMVEELRALGPAGYSAGATSAPHKELVAD
jgi:F420-non-reducing hydrogenase iron-sulfur subunit